MTGEADASGSLQVSAREDVERYVQIHRKKKIILETCEDGFWMDHTSINTGAGIEQIPYLSVVEEEPHEKSVIHSQ